MTNKPAKPVVNPSLASEAFMQKRWREVALGHPDTPANERAMFTSFVGVREHYDLAPGGILIGRGTIVRWYSPIAAADLPQLVAKLADASDGELQEFARNYGNLGFTTLTADLKKAFYTWPDGQETMGGDPADWLRAHGANVKRCLEITRCLQLPKDAFAREFDAALVGGVATDDRETWETIDAAFGAVTESINVLIRRRSEIVKAARSVRAALVNPNISGIHRALRSDLGSHGEESAFVFRAPIEAVYWHIANAADGGIVRFLCDHEIATFENEFGDFLKSL